MDTLDHWLQRVRVGAWFGIGLGTLYSVVASILYFVRGGALLDGADASLPAVIGVYLGGGALSGAIVGLLVPLSASVAGAAIVGMFAVAPVVLGARVVLRGFAPWDATDTIMVAVVSLAVGSGTGALSRYILNADERER